jgi:diaminopimelate epimerase
MKSVPFMKMSGVGNDFIIIDNRENLLQDIELHHLARQVCKRRESLGGDELILIERSAMGGDFFMRTINPDGIEVKMCGNAARCVARYAFFKGFASTNMVIDTQGGPIHAVVAGEHVQVQLQITSEPQLNRRLVAGPIELIIHSLEISGTPHLVFFLEDVFAASQESIRQTGSLLRWHPEFPEGINANFVQVVNEHQLRQRTFERGVEGETLACGTGAAASSVICSLLNQVDSPVQVDMLGGRLNISFSRPGEDFFNLYLSGSTRFVAEGLLLPEAWT